MHELLGLFAVAARQGVCCTKDGKLCLQISCMGWSVDNQIHNNVTISIIRFESREYVNLRDSFITLGPFQNILTHLDSFHGSGRLC